MPYKITVEGMAEVSELLDNLGEQAEAIAAKALYEGARVMADEINDQIKKIKTAPFKYAKGGETRLPSPEEKAILETHGVGIAKFDKSGGAEVDTSVGVDTNGYVNVSFAHMNAGARTNYKLVDGKNVGSMKARLLGKGKGAQNQKPLGVIANAINSGTSFMQKQPFVRKAASSGGKKAIEAMKTAIEAEIEAMTKK